MTAWKGFSAACLAWHLVILLCPPMVGRYVRSRLAEGSWSGGEQPLPLSPSGVHSGPRSIAASYGL
jgi:hypothetical protein